MAAIAQAIRFAADHGARVINMSLGGPFPVSAIGSAIKYARGKGVTVRDAVTQGKPSAEIVRMAQEEGVDMIVLGTHGKGMLDKAIFGSTTERVVRRAPCPVLTCRLAEHAFVADE